MCARCARSRFEMPLAVSVTREIRERSASSIQTPHLGQPHNIFAAHVMQPATSCNSNLMVQYMDSVLPNTLQYEM